MIQEVEVKGMDVDQAVLGRTCDTLLLAIPRHVGLDVIEEPPRLRTAFSHLGANTGIEALIALQSI